VCGGLLDCCRNRPMLLFGESNCDDVRRHAPMSTEEVRSDANLERI
jgi:hypothetical protein